MMFIYSVRFMGVKVLQHLKIYAWLIKI